MTTAPSRGPSSRRTAKVLVTGPPGAGTTTFIASLTGSAPGATERGAAPDGRAAARSDTSTDVGRLEVADDLTLVVYGTPAQDRYGFLMDFLAEGMLGYVLLVDGADADAFTEARQLRDRFEQAYYRVPSVVVVTKSSGDAQRLERRVRDELELPPGVPVVTVDARQPADVRRAVVGLLTVALGRAARRAAAGHAYAGLGDVG